MKKKLVVLVLAGAVFLSGMGILNVSAANYSDTKFSFTLGRLGGNDYTGARQKQNATSSYVKLKSIGKGSMDAWILKSNGANVRSKQVTVTQGRSKKITNYAYEKYGKCKVKLAAETSKTQLVRVSATGVWSPDSI
ncbi:DUF2712 domain-containing protein [Listeria sp. FSL L7-1509]|uniref:DUF2712 domain-containing protein n=1 Tax=Listeria immobilis TaxID=2713502 RepID=A0ABR6SZ41_9LIST|nr:DUF2712 domain-containing protein [Listeria immobilis]MBC1483823.1 DUF2712 domain-containing protein [Listeria immobilis]MBC1507908.1 DUF2712 domain-containing protein [Listeria immobilis]MBC1510894.1 DUF2712 domain-containing protein [Listeria immobilis]MBC6304167.1 DUF2712 domain-containing protein [Listeria immobilis]MBC6313539.1 DUF2712 domain-containing protein [Listeria immobilis]